MTIMPLLSQTILLYICGPSVIIPSAPFHAQKCLRLHNKPYSHLSDKYYAG